MLSTWRTLGFVAGCTLVLAGLLQALSATQVASVLAASSLPHPAPRALVGAWIHIGWHSLLIGGIALGAVAKPGPWARPALLLLSAIAAADALFMIAFVGVHLTTALLAAPALLLFGAWWVFDPRDTSPAAA